MSLLTLLNTSPSAGPLSNGWSLWDIGCCCQEEYACGCVNFDNYSNDFNTEVGTGWTVVNGVILRRVSNQLWSNDWTPSHGLDKLYLSGMYRCLALPDMTGKYIFIQWDTEDLPYATSTRLGLNLVEEIGVGALIECREYYSAWMLQQGATTYRTQMFASYSDSGGLDHGSQIVSDGVGTTQRIEIHATEIKWLRDGIEIASHSTSELLNAIAVNAIVEMSSARDVFVFPSPVKHYSKVDNFSFGVEDEPP